jgi:hypothetical protein
MKLRFQPIKYENKRIKQKKKPLEFDLNYVFIDISLFDGIFSTYNQSHVFS